MIFTPNFVEVQPRLWACIRKLHDYFAFLYRFKKNSMPQLSIQILILFLIFVDEYSDSDFMLKEIMAFSLARFREPIALNA